MRALALLVSLVPASVFASQNDDGFIWIDANTRIKVTPTAAGAGSTTPPKPVEEPKKEKKDPPKK